MAAPVGVLSLALDFVSNEVAASSASGGGSIEESLTRLPMLLVEDFLESQVSRAESRTRKREFYVKYTNCVSCEVGQLSGQMFRTQTSNSRPPSPVPVRRHETAVKLICNRHDETGI